MLTATIVRNLPSPPSKRGEGVEFSKLMEIGGQKMFARKGGG